VISGQYVFADTLPNEALPQLKAARGVKPVLVRPDWMIFMVLNTKGGATANVKVRQAMQAALNVPDMLAAAFGDPALFDVDGSVYGKGAAFYDGVNTRGFNQRDPKKAAQLLKEAGYKGEPIRLLTSTQFDYFYKQTLVAKENLEEAGFKVDVQVMDWASVTQKRTNANEWEGFIAYHHFTPEPRGTERIPLTVRETEPWVCPGPGSCRAPAACGKPAAGPAPGAPRRHGPAGPRRR